MKNDEYFINNPIFLKIRKRFNFLWLSQDAEIIKALVNERIIEIPFALNSLPLEKDRIVVDLGCRESSLSLHCASLGYRVIGVDFRNYPYVHPNLRFVRADSALLPLKNNFCDVVLAISTIEHIGLESYDVPSYNRGDYAALKEIYRILRVGGVFLMSVPFGEKRVNSRQRFYDYESIMDLLKRFHIDSIQFYIHRVIDSNFRDYWEEASREVAENIESTDWTEAIALVKASKNL